MLLRVSIGIEELRVEVHLIIESVHKRENAQELHRKATSRTMVKVVNILVLVHLFHSGKIVAILAVSNAEADGCDTLWHKGAFR